MTLTGGSLFSGAGGLDLAIEDVLGVDTMWQCEINPAAATALAAHWACPNLVDITAIDWAAIEPVDVLSGGFPCQDVSSAGRRAGMRTGTRTGLWSHFATGIDALRPRIVVIENVRGLLNAEAHRHVEPDPTIVGNPSGRHVLRAAGAVLGDLADLGYDGRWATVPASAVGAPHRRERVFIIATPADATPAAHPRGPRPDHGGHPVTLLPTPVAGDAQSCRNSTSSRQPDSRHHTGDTLTDAVDLLPTPVTYDGDSEDTLRIGGNLTLKGAVAGVDPKESARLLLPKHPVNKERARRNLPPITAPPTIDADDVYLLPTPTGGGDDDVDLGDVVDWGRYQPAIRRWEHRTRAAPPPTTPAARDGGMPRLNPAFAEWMMGWPAGWVTDLPLSRAQQLRIIGNGVCPQQAIAALHQLLSIEVSA